MRKKPARTTSQPLPAATIILVRPGPNQFQLFLVKRSTKSSFMAGNYVFPGGILDTLDEDIDQWQGHGDVPMQDMMNRIGIDNSTTATVSFAIAAIRETFEEAGVFVGDGDSAAIKKIAAINAKRQQQKLSKDWLLELVRGYNVSLAFSKLRSWAHWITPAKLPKRFDTRFYIVFAAPDQMAAPDNREATDGLWISPQKALGANLAGEIPLSPPTLVTLHQLLQYTDLNHLRDESRQRPWGKPILPKLIRTPRGPIFIEPWDPEYNTEIQIDLKDLEKRILPVGSPFSRVWHHDGIWKTVAV